MKIDCTQIDNTTTTLAGLKPGDTFAFIGANPPALGNPALLTDAKHFVYLDDGVEYDVNTITGPAPVQLIKCSLKWEIA